MILTNSNGLRKDYAKHTGFIKTLVFFETCMSFNNTNGVGKGPRTWAEAEGHE